MLFLIVFGCIFFEFLNKCFLYLKLENVLSNFEMVGFYLILNIIIKIEVFLYYNLISKFIIVDYN